MSSLDRTRYIFVTIVGIAILIVISVILYNTIRKPDSTSSSTPFPTSSSPPAGNNIEKILILTSDTKAEWVESATERFNAAGFQTGSGKTIFVEFREEGSPADAQQAVVDMEIQPDVWSPGDMSWVETANQVWRELGRGSLVTGDCPRTVLAPTGFAMWQPMAEALGWPDTPIGWEEIIALAEDPDGWGRYGQSVWGQFKFGHTHPSHSNTGFSMLATLAYDALDMTSGLTPELVKSEPVIEAFRTVELHTFHYGTSTKLLMNKMAERGPYYLQAVTGSETAVIANNRYVPAPDEKRWPYVFIFPKEGTFWSDNPFCVLDAEWVDDEEREAALLYRDFLLAPDQQELAIDIGLRPANADIPLHDPISLEFHTDPRVSRETVPPLEVVSGETARAIIDVFNQTKKKATVVVVLDTSASMAGAKIANATEGTVTFINQLQRNDEALVLTFADEVRALEPSGRVGDIAESLDQTLRSLFAGGSTALFDAVCQSVTTVTELQAEDEAANEQRLYGIVVLSDGEDTDSDNTVDDMFNCLPSGEAVEGVKIFTIAYGEEANEALLLRIANRTNGRSFTGGPETIEDIYRAISSEQ